MIDPIEKDSITQNEETIAAIATPPGRGGIGVIRISGFLTLAIAEQLLQKKPIVRQAVFTAFLDSQQHVIDEGIALYFKSPHSFTGEDVLELQGHGGPVILDELLQRVIQLGARLAKPGEFSERAFLNDKIDLSQAEAIADLIDASSKQAAQSAVRSLSGDFSRQINQLVEALIELRMYVEAAIDFPEEEIDFLSDSHIINSLTNLIKKVTTIKGCAKQGALLREGMTVVIAGKPNVGKSSLLNALSGEESAIVTQVAGTTRDLLKEQIDIDGMPVHVIDTAGLRITEDIVEQEGINRAHRAIIQADEIIFVTDDEIKEDLQIALKEQLGHLGCDITKVTIIKNKIDLQGQQPQISQQNNHRVIYLSAKENQGIDLLKQHLKEKMGYEGKTEGVFIARRRHLEALEKASLHLEQGYEQLTVHQAGEFLAEELRLAQITLSEITGEFTTEDLLGKIFSSFCIGK